MLGREFVQQVSRVMPIYEREDLVSRLILSKFVDVFPYDPHFIDTLELGPGVILRGILLALFHVIMEQSI